MSTIYFAWVAPTETTFNPSTHARLDEHLLSLEIEHAEGGLPTANVEIKNPQIGLLNLHRLYWAWISYLSPEDGVTTVTPLFFGRLVGIPSEMTELTLTLKFLARPSSYIQLKQKVAETLKVAPFYDEVFFDLTKQDDPDVILEGYSALYHVDRTTLAVSVSDILEGEDGTQVFAASNVFYDSVKVKINQSPVRAVAVQADVSWNQEYFGRFPVTQGALETYTGQHMIDEWPTTGTVLGGGYTVEVGFGANMTSAIDYQSIIGNYSYTFHFQNFEKNHTTGDTMTIDVQGSYPSALAGVPGFMFRYKNIDIPALIAPDTVDKDGNPDPTNTPALIQQESVFFASWAAVYQMTMHYQCKRQRQERISFTLSADTQAVITDPLITEDTETITLTGRDVSQPLVNYLNWSSVEASAVSQGTVVFPDDPTVPGQNSAQVCIGAGTAGTAEPIFSNIAGVETVDGSVTWVSLGSNTPQSSFPDWSRAAPVPLGSIIIPRPMFGKDFASLALPGTLVFPPHGFPVSMHELLTQDQSSPGGMLMECSVPGYAGFGVVSAQFVNVSNPTGKYSYICTTSGISGIFHPVWNETPGATTTDGTVVWTNMGLVNLPVGGFPGMTGARSYFPSDRGLQSLEHLMCRARAKLRLRARAVEVTWQTRFESLLGMSCRMNATVPDPRLPGGTASGKVISYRLVFDAGGNRYGEVTIGCSVGFGGTVTGSGGTADYIEDGFTDPTYYQPVGLLNVAATGDLAYAPPVEAPVDDGVTFPISGSAVILDATLGGGQGLELTAIQEACQQLSAQASSQQQTQFQPSGQFDGTVSSLQVSQPNFLGAIQAAFNALGIPGVWFSLSLKPLDTGPFVGAYVVDVGNLVLPMTIDLEAAATVF